MFPILYITSVYNKNTYVYTSIMIYRYVIVIQFNTPINKDNIDTIVLSSCHKQKKQQGIIYI